MCKIESTLFIALLFAINSCAQLAPANDANWQLVPALSDEFNGTSLGSLWRVLDTCNPPILLNNSEGIGAWGSHEQCQEDNTYLDGNNICFKLLPFQNPSLDVPCVPFRNVGHSQNYSSGGVISYGEYYEYGYFEMEAQLPGYFDANGSPSGYAFWPAFWTSSWEVVNSCYLRKFEIDILEPDGTINQYGSANRNVCGLWIVKPDNQCEAYKRIQSQVTSSQPLFTGFHKYAAEHLKDRLIFYFDDQPFAELWGIDSLESQSGPQFVIMDAQIGPSYVSPRNFEIPWPLEMKVNYFRYYKLNSVECNNDYQISSQIGLTTFNYLTRRNLTIGGGANQIEIQTTGQGKKVFRASNSLYLDGSNEVLINAEDASSQYYIINECNQ